MQGASPDGCRIQSSLIYTQKEASQAKPPPFSVRGVAAWSHLSPTRGRKAEATSGNYFFYYFYMYNSERTTVNLLHAKSVRIPPSKVKCNSDNFLSGLFAQHLK
jgi:hypothetical protein